MECIDVESEREREKSDTDLSMHYIFMDIQTESTLSYSTNQIQLLTIELIILYCTRIPLSNSWETSKITYINKYITNICAVSRTRKDIQQLIEAWYIYLNDSM